MSNEQQVKSYASFKCNISEMLNNSWKIFFLLFFAEMIVTFQKEKIVVNQ